MRNIPVGLIALAVSAFAIGTTEFVIMGLLPQVAQNLGVSIPKAGWLISGYALGVFIGAPIMAMATQKLPQRTALIVLMSIFVLGNIFCAVAPTYGALMAARILTSLCHGAFFGIGAVVAASFVPPARRAQAMALMFSGLTLANVLGVPLGTALGQAAGWRTTFWAVAAIGISSLVALLILLPRDRRTGKAPAMVDELRALHGPVLLALSITVIASSSMFTLFSYIAPVLNEITGVSARGVTYTLFLLGVGMTVGNYVGGRLTDWRLGTTMIGTFLVITAILALLFVASSTIWMTEMLLFVWAGAVLANSSALQISAINLGRGAPNLISTLNIGAFNAGNALGAWVGGQVISRGFGLGTIPLVASGLACLALCLAVLSFVLRKRGPQGACGHLKKVA